MELHGAWAVVLCALVALRSSTGLRFGNTTLVHERFAFQELGSVMEVYCSAPQGSNSTMLSFVFGSSMHYAAATTPEYVSLVDNVTAKFTWQFSNATDVVTSIYCEVLNIEGTPTNTTEQHEFSIYVSKAPSLSQSPLRCVVSMAWTSADSGLGTVACDLQRSLHTRRYTGVSYTLYLVNSTGTEAEDKLLWSGIDSHPTKRDHPPLSLEFSIESSIVARIDHPLLKIVFFERFSNRTIAVMQRLNLLDSLVLPPDTLIWQPFSNSTGFLVMVHAGLLSPMCGSRTYTAELNISSPTDDQYKGRSFTLRCNPCVDGTSMCSTVIGGLAPAQQYSVALRQRLLDTSNAELHLGELLQPAQETSLFTEEQAPLVGPELHPFYQIMDCDGASTACRLSRSCAIALKNGACQVVRIFWKAIPKNLSNGKISFYVLHIVKKWHDLTEETVNLTGQAKMAEIYRHPSQRLSITIAGGTSKGLPPVTQWSNSTIPSQGAEQDNILPRNIMLSRRSPVEGPCNISWFIEASNAVGVAAQNATLLHCSGEAPGCQEYTFWSIRAELTANGGWLPLERLLWSSDQLGNGNDFLCREGTLALAIAPSAAAQIPFMTRLEAVDCHVTTGNGVNSTAAKITPSNSDSDGMCLKWLPPFPVVCDTAPGRIVLLNLSLLSRDRGRVLEQQVLSGSTTDHCFSRETIEDAETYYASLTWAADVGLPEPYFIGPAEVMLNTPGLTPAAKSGVALAGVVCATLVVVGLVGCARKARAYQKTWRANLTIPKIKITTAGQDCEQLTSSTLVVPSCAVVATYRRGDGPDVATDHSTVVATDQKCIYDEISRATAEQPSDRLRKWSSKDSAFASQDSSSPPVDNDQSSSLRTDGHVKETESNADVTCEVYTTLDGLLHVDLRKDSLGGLACHQRTKAKQSQRLHGEDKGSVAHCLSDDASPLLLGFVSDCSDGCHQVYISGGFKEDCTSDYKFSDGDPSQSCSSALNQRGQPRTSGTWAPACRYEDQVLREPHDDTTSIASYAFAAVDVPDSASSNCVSASDPQACGSDLEPYFRCLECEDAVAPEAMGYITVSDAIKMAAA